MRASNIIIELAVLTLATRGLVGSTLTQGPVSPEFPHP